MLVVVKHALFGIKAYEQVMNIYKFKLRVFLLNNQNVEEANEKKKCLSNKYAISYNHHVGK